MRKQNISGLYHATASIRSLLKSGLGRFGLQKQPHPADNAVVIMFVVGGISMLELREVQQAVDNQISQGGKLPQLLTGGTVLLRPRDMYHNLCSPKSTLCGEFSVRVFTKSAMLRSCFCGQCFSGLSTGGMRVSKIMTKPFVSLCANVLADLTHGCSP